MMRGGESMEPIEEVPFIRLSRLLTFPDICATLRPIGEQ